MASVRAATHTRSEWQPYALLTLAVLFWSGNWVVARALRFDVSPVAITFWRWAIALVVLLPFTLPRVMKQWTLIARAWRVLLLLGALATVCQHIPVYTGLRHTTATNGALLNATAPLFMALLSLIFIGTRLDAKQIIGSVFAVAGVVTVITHGDAGVLRALRVNEGDLWVLLGTICWASYTVCLRWRPRGVDGLALLTCVAAIGVAATGPLYAFELSRGVVTQASAASVLGLLYIGISSSVLSYIFWNGAVQQIGPARAGPFMYLMLVFTPALSMLFLGEHLHLYHLAGGILIVSGIYLTTGRSVE